MRSELSEPAGLNQRTQVDRVDFLDGIRGWASVVVLLSHIIGSVLALVTPELDANSFSDFKLSEFWRVIYDVYGVLLRIFTDGRLAVLIFFVLSGYALSVSHFNLQKNALALATASRYFRLTIPILFTSLIAYVMLKAGLFFNLEAAARFPVLSDWLGSFYKFHGSIQGVLSFATYDVFFRYRSEVAYNALLWTMPVELMGSFMIYGFLALFKRSNAVQWGISLLLALAFLCSTPLYACFIMGYLIAELNRIFVGKITRKGSDIFLVCAFLAVSGVAILRQFIEWGDFVTYDAATCLIATALVTSVSFSSGLRAFFSNRLSKFLGRISFPLYLIQIIVICSWSSFLYLKMPVLGGSVVLAAVINLLTTISLCIGLSALLIPIERLSIFASKTLGGYLLIKDAVRPFRESRASLPPA